MRITGYLRRFLEMVLDPANNLTDAQLASQITEALGAAGDADDSAGSAFAQINDLQTRLTTVENLEVVDPSEIVGDGLYRFTITCNNVQAGDKLVLSAQINRINSTSMGCEAGVSFAIGETDEDTAIAICDFYNAMGLDEVGDLPGTSAEVNGAVVTVSTPYYIYAVMTTGSGLAYVNDGSPSGNVTQKLGYFGEKIRYNNVTTWSQVNALGTKIGPSFIQDFHVEINAVTAGDTILFSFLDGVGGAEKKETFTAVAHGTENPTSTQFVLGDTGAENVGAASSLAGKLSAWLTAQGITDRATATYVSGAEFVMHTHIMNAIGTDIETQEEDAISISIDSVIGSWDTVTGMLLFYIMEASIRAALDELSISNMDSRLDAVETFITNHTQ